MQRQTLVQEKNQLSKEATESLVKGLSILTKCGFNTPDNCTFLTEHAEFASEIAKGLEKWFEICSRKNDPGTFVTRDYLLKSAIFKKEGDKLDKGLTFLIHFAINTFENRTFLTQHAEFATSVAEALLELHDAGLNNPENRSLISRYPSFAFAIARGVVELTKVKLNTEENYALLIQHLPSVHGVIHTFFMLHFSALNTQENFYSLIKYRDFTSEIKHELSYLNIFKLTQYHFNSIIKKIDILVRETQKGKKTFLMASRSAKSPALIFFKSPMADPNNLIPEIYKFLPSLRRMKLKPAIG